MTKPKKGKKEKPLKVDMTADELLGLMVKTKAPKSKKKK